MDRKEALKTVKDIQARQLELVAQGRTLEANHQNMDQKVDDLTRAVNTLTARNFQDPTPEGGNLKLRGYVRQDAEGATTKANPVRWTAEEENVRLPNGQTVKTVSHGLLTDPNPADHWHQDLLKMFSLRNLARLAQEMSGADANTPHLDVELFHHLQRAPDPTLRAAITKSFYDTAGSGAEWIPDQFIPSVYQEFQTPRRARALLQTIPVTGNSIIRPRVTTGARPYIKGNISSDDPRRYTPSTPVTADTTISMSGLAVRVLADDAALEDSAVAAATILRREIVSALDDGFEDYMFNGDSDATHQDTALSSWNIRSRWGATGLGGDADHRRYGLGWRAAAFDASTTTDLSGTMSAANWATMLSDLGERGMGNVVGFVSPEAMIQNFLTLAQVLTVDAYGPSATVLSGELAQFLGVPLVMTRFLSADMPATGLYTTSGATTSALVVDMDAYQRYVKRGATVEVDKDISSGAVEMVATVREVMDTPDAAATANVALGFNL